MILPRKTKKRMQHSRAPGPLPHGRAPIICTGFPRPLPFGGTASNYRFEGA